MKSNFTQIRRLNMYALRSLCIMENWYTNGTGEDYTNLLCKVDETANITTADLEAFARDILNHSNFGGCFDNEEDLLMNIMFCIAKACTTTFVKAQ